MGLFSRLRSLFATESKALTTPPPQPAAVGGWYGAGGGSSVWFDMLGAAGCAGGKIDYVREVGDGLDSSVVAAPVLWIAKNFTEAPFVVYKKQGKEETIVDGHPLSLLISKPNPFYDGLVFLMATLIDWCVTGNAYWIVVRDETLMPVQLWFAPSWTMTPRWNPGGNSYVDWYDYSPLGSSMPLETTDVVHLRNGLNPRNVRLGLSPLASEVRGIFTDDEAGRYASAILYNMGVPGLMVSPKADNASVTEEKAAAIRDKIDDRTRGANRGKTIVMTGSTTVEQFGFSPKDLDLSSLRDVSEERVCALLSIPPAVVGFGTGLETTKVGATMKEMRQLAWEACLVPNQRLIAKQVEASLLPEFEGSPEGFAAGFDRSKVTALQEDETARAARWNSQVQAGYVKVAEARKAFNLPVDLEDDVYLRSVGTVETGPGAPEPAPTPPALLPFAGPNGRPAPGQQPPPKEPPPPKSKAPLEAKAPTRQQRAIVARNTRSARVLEKHAKNDLRKFYKTLGAAAAASAQRVFAGAGKGKKDDLPDVTLEQHLADRIAAGMNISTAVAEYRRLYGQIYLRTAEQTVNGLVDTFGLVIDAPDHVARQVIAEGGRRAGLVDLDQQTKEALFEAIHEGRSLGEGPADLVARIAEVVPAGPWDSVETRSKVVARTETMHAQRYSTLEAYRGAENVTSVMIFDNRIGFDDADCMARDQQVVTFEEASAMMEDEHPNGTLAFAPVVGGD